MQNPVTSYIGGRIRTINKKDYDRKLEEDSNLSNREYLMEYGNQIFENLDRVIDLTEEETIEYSTRVNFIPLSKEKADFYLEFVLENGVRSLRRGYYKMISFPIKVLNSKIEVWQTTVLYSKGLGYSEVYKYDCNISPLVNRLAVWSNPKNNIIRVLKVDDKQTALNKLVNKVIYVSSAHTVTYDQFEPAKEILWFSWN